MRPVSTDWVRQRIIFSIESGDKAVDVVRYCRRVSCVLCEPELRDKSPQQQCSGSLWAHQAENVHKVQGTMERLL